MLRRDTLPRRGAPAGAAPNQSRNVPLNTVRGLLHAAAQAEATSVAAEDCPLLAAVSEAVVLGAEAAQDCIRIGKDSHGSQPAAPRPPKQAEQFRHQTKSRCRPPHGGSKSSDPGEAPRQDI